MLFKIAALFLVAMAVLALFGRLRFPGALKRPLPRAPKAPAKPLICGKCGKFIIGSGRCDCTDPPPRKG